MPDVLVRNVDQAVLDKLKDQAEKNGRSLQNELVQILSSVIGRSRSSDTETAEKIKRSLRGRKFSDSAQILREDRAR